MSEAKRILALAATSSDVDRFRDVAGKLALELLVACSDDSAALRLNFDSRDSALRIVEFAHQQPLAAVLALSDDAVPVAARACSMLGLPFHTPKAADACKDKALLIRTLAAHHLVAEPAADAPDLLFLAAMMSESRLRVLAVSDTAGRVFALSDFQSALRERIVGVLRAMIPALGLKHGPVHVALAAATACVQDVSLACSGGRADNLHFRIPLVDQDMSFEEVVVRNALGLDMSRVYLGR